MDHVVIMRREWKLTDQILCGQKTVETRWYKHKCAPWDRIKSGDTVYFKDTGQPVTAKATVGKVEQYDNVDEALRQKLVTKYLQSDVGGESLLPEIEAYTRNKPYCIIVHLIKPESVEPFQVTKKGFGLQSAWIVVPDIRKIMI